MAERDSSHAPAALNVRSLLRSLSPAAILFCVLIPAAMAAAIPGLSWLLTQCTAALIRVLELSAPDTAITGLVCSILELAFTFLGFITLGFVSAGFFREAPIPNIVVLTAASWLSFAGGSYVAAFLGYPASLQLFIGTDTWLIVFCVIGLVLVGAWGATGPTGALRAGSGYVCCCLVIAAAAARAVHAAPVVLAHEPPLIAPFREPICIGYHPHNAARPWGPVNGRCDPDEVVMGAFGVFASSRFTPADRIGFSAACCPLPAGDIFEPVHLQTTRACPDGFVVTSGTTFDRSCPNCVQSIRCTKINTTRYQLGAPEPGRYLGQGSARAKDPGVLLDTDLPLALRFGLRRTGRYSFVGSSCVAQTPGSLLVAKNSKRCRSFTFRQLQYRGLPGDPAAGTPVAMFPDCDALVGVYDGQPRCLTAATMQSRGGA